ncbi:hypothetical protein ACQRIU_006349 [Beauveria bassiana]
MGRIHDAGEYHGHNPDILLTLERRLRYISQIIRVVSDLHSIGVVHADFHPANITLDPPSKDHLANLFATPPLEHDGGVPAPELLKSIGQTALPFKVDSWALGNVIYFVLTGWNCFAVQNLDEYRLSLDELRAGQNESINELPEDVKSLYLPLILGLLEMDPEKRLAVEEISQGPYSEVMNVD